MASGLNGMEETSDGFHSATEESKWLPSIQQWLPCYRLRVINGTFYLFDRNLFRVFFVFSKKWRGKTENVAGLFSDFIASIPLFSEKQFSENRNKHV